MAASNWPIPIFFLMPNPISFAIFRASGHGVPVTNGCFEDGPQIKQPGRPNKNERSNTQRYASGQ